ncbi:MAG: hypothetical protein Q9204_006233 [Flavoplaca sp. TL-2023a]
MDIPQRPGVRARHRKSYHRTPMAYPTGRSQFPSVVEDSEKLACNSGVERWNRVASDPFRLPFDRAPTSMPS